MIEIKPERLYYGLRGFDDGSVFLDVTDDPRGLPLFSIELEEEPELFRRLITTAKQWYEDREKK